MRDLRIDRVGQSLGKTNDEAEIEDQITAFQTAPSSPQALLRSAPNGLQEIDLKELRTPIIRTAILHGSIKPPANY